MPPHQQLSGHLPNARHERSRQFDAVCACARQLGELGSDACAAGFAGVRRPVQSRVAVACAHGKITRAHASHGLGRVPRTSTSHPDARPPAICSRKSQTSGADTLFGGRWPSSSRCERGRPSTSRRWYRPRRLRRAKKGRPGWPWRPSRVHLESVALCESVARECRPVKAKNACLAPEKPQILPLQGHVQ